MPVRVRPTKPAKTKPTKAAAAALAAAGLSEDAERDDDYIEWFTADNMPFDKRPIGS